LICGARDNVADERRDHQLLRYARTPIRLEGSLKAGYWLKAMQDL
jgi:hypothetical protein